MILDRIIRGFRNSTYRNPEPWLMEWMYGGMPSDSGVPVNTQSALKYAPFWEAVNLISGDIGKLPLPVYKRLGDSGRERDRKHPAYYLLNYEANAAMTADVFKEVMQAHTLTCGNGRALILRNRASEPEQLIPLIPERTETRVVDGRVVHLVKIGEAAEPTPYLDENVLHIKGMGYDGIVGYSVVTMARNSLGLGIAAEKHGSRTFKNFAVPPIILETEQHVKKDDALQLLQDWEKYHGGQENVGKTGLLHSGTKAHMLSMPNRDAQWLELRKFQRVDVAGWFRLPPHKLGDDSRISYNSLEQEELSYLTGCMVYWFVRWQNECRRKLLREREKENDSHYFEFFADLLASVDFPAKVAALNTLVAATIFSPNEAREKLNMNHRTGGDAYENPNTNSREAAKPVEPKPEPKRPPRPMPTPEDVAKLIFPQLIGDPRLQGAAGPQGERGEQGPRGEPGPAGERGEGVAGRDGERGPQDEAGPPSLYGRCLDVISAAVQSEASIVRHHAAHAKNFTSWYETWYPRWQAKFVADITRLGADAALAVEHCDESQRQLAKLTETATMETLVADVQLLTASWAERGVVLARRIAGGELPNTALAPETMVSTPSGLGTIKAIDADWLYQVELHDGSSITTAEVEPIG